jgi:glycerol-3-phosphate dehydrogenase (NAD(P)+)
MATARAAVRLAEKHGVEMPIAAAVADVLDGTSTIPQAMEALLSRPLKEE